MAYAPKHYDEIARTLLTFGALIVEFGMILTLAAGGFFGAFAGNRTYSK